MKLNCDVHEGTGPYLLLVHGVLSGRAQWQPNLAALRRVARPVVVELWGHGRSLSPEDPALYQPPAYVRAFDELRVALGIERWLVCGQSLGAALTLRYALDHPDRLIAHVFTNSVSALADADWVTQTRAAAAGLANAIEQGGQAVLERLPIHAAAANASAASMFTAWPASSWRVSFSPDRARYIGVRSDRTAFLAQTDRGSPSKEVGDGALADIQDAVFCGDGTRLVTASASGEVALLDGTTGRVHTRFPVQGSPPRVVDCTQDGARVLAAHSDGRTLLWDGTSAGIVATLPVRAPAKAAAFSPDGSRLVVGDIDGDLLVFDAQSGAGIAALSPHAKSVTHLAYAANGNRFLSSSEDGTVRVWEAGSNELMATLRVADQDALYADFTREDGEELIVGDGVGGASLFSIAPRSLLSRGCGLLRGTPAFELVQDDCAPFAY